MMVIRFWGRCQTDESSPTCFQDKKAQQPPLQILPMLSEVRSALPLMTINGKKVEKPEDVGVPLFYTVVGDKEEYMIK